MPSRNHILVITSIALGFTAACSPTGGATLKDLPPEESLNCAANLFAVNNLMEIKPGNADAEAVKANGLGAITHYGTIYAEAESISSDEVLGLMKLKAYRMTGRLPGGPKASASTIIERAKACITPEAA
jgi:hypothetical protein